MLSNENTDLQELRERGYDGIADEITEGLQKWDNWFAGYKASVIEDYFQGNARVEVHFFARIAGHSGPSHEYLVHFERSDVCGTICNVADVLVTMNSESDGANPFANRPSGTGGKLAMLIDYVQVMDLPKWMRRVAVPSLVRLERLDGVPCGGVDAPDLLCRGPQEVSEITKNGKLRPGLLFVRHSGCGFNGKSERKMVKTGTQIKDTLSDKNIESIRGGTNAINSESPWLKSIWDSIRRGIRVWLIDDAVGFSIDPLSGLLIEGIEVFVRTITPGTGPRRMELLQ